ncbi:hypothetical protein STREPTOSP366_26400 [Streptomyces variabilis]
MAPVALVERRVAQHGVGPQPRVGVGPQGVAGGGVHGGRGCGGRSSDATRGKATTLDGTEALTLTEQDGEDRYTFYVATEGEPYLLRLESTSAADPGSVTFTDFGKPVPAEKPEGEILGLDALG